MKDNSILDTLIEIALKEDLGDAGDITSNFFIDNNSLSIGTIIAKENCVIAGSEIAERVFKRLDPNIEVKVELPSGSIASTGDVIISLSGKSCSILSTERIALNFLQRLSGIATITKKYVDAVKGTNAKILDTRKTTPGWRVLEKMAVKSGGGLNHRMGLFDMAMLKDYRTWTRRWLWKFRRSLTNSDYVFPFDDGKPFHKSATQRRFEQIEKRAKVRHLGLHACRHTHASNLIRANENIKKVQKRLGHSTPSITADTYAHLFKEDVDRDKIAIANANIYA